MPNGTEIATTSTKTGYNTFTLTSKTRAFVRANVAVGVTAPAALIKPMLEYGQYPTAYVPFSGINGYEWDNPPDYGVPAIPTMHTTATKVNGEFYRCQIRYQHIAAFEPVIFRSHTLTVETQRIR